MFGTIILYQCLIENIYISNDAVATISKVTDDIVKQAAPEVRRKYIPHAVNGKVFQTIHSRTN